MSVSNGQLAAFTGTTLLIGGIVSLVVIVFAIFCWWRILSKAGYSGALSLLLLIPGIDVIVALVLLFLLVFGEWPVLTELNARRQQASYPSAQPGGYAANPSYPQYPQGPQYPR